MKLFKPGVLVLLTEDFSHLGISAGDVGVVVANRVGQVSGLDSDVVDVLVGGSVRGFYKFCLEVL